MSRHIIKPAVLAVLFSAAVCTAASAESHANSSRILIAYFSRVGNTEFPVKTDTDTRASVNVTKGSIEGNTEHIARMIQHSTGGDLHLIKTERTYPVNYRTLVDEAKKDKDAAERPALAGEPINMDDYDTVFIGYPNWWYSMPMAVYSFLEAYDLSGKTVIPFVTHGGSGFSDTRAAIADLQPGARLLNGLSVYGKAASGVRQADIDSWLASLGL